RFFVSQIGPAAVRRSNARRTWHRTRTPKSLALTLSSFATSSPMEIDERVCGVSFARSLAHGKVTLNISKRVSCGQAFVLM
ncbi:MAG: hypothetical protein AAF384_14460, partial [Pseudomonadota bacterium]